MRGLDATLQNHTHHKSPISVPLSLGTKLMGLIDSVLFDSWVAPHLRFGIGGLLVIGKCQIQRLGLGTAVASDWGIREHFRLSNSAQHEFTAKTQED